MSNNTEANAAAVSIILIISGVVGIVASVDLLINWKWALLTLSLIFFASGWRILGNLPEK